MAAGVLTAWASGYNCLRVHLSDGGKVDILLHSDLQVRFSATHLQAEGGNVNVEVPKADIIGFEHRHEEGSGIEEVAVETGGMTRSGDLLMFDGLPADSRVAVYTASGVAVRQAVVSGQSEVSLEGLAAGTYIVTANGKSYKITIR